MYAVSSFWCKLWAWRKIHWKHSLLQVVGALARWYIIGKMRGTTYVDYLCASGGICSGEWITVSFGSINCNVGCRICRWMPSPFIRIWWSQYLSYTSTATGSSSSMISVLSTILLLKSSISRTAFTSNQLSKCWTGRNMHTSFLPWCHRNSAMMLG